MTSKNKKANHKLKVNCGQGNNYCDQNLFLLFNPQHKDDVYKVIINIEIPFFLESSVSGVYFFGRTINGTYTKFLVYLRYICLLFSVVFGYFYFTSLYKLPKPLVTFEHKFIAVLSIFLIFFNDPLFYFQILGDSIILSIYTTFSIVIFISLLIFFWIIMIQRIYKENVKIDSHLLNKTNILIFTSLFIILLITCMVMLIIAKVDPGFHLNAEYPTAFNIFLICVGLLAIVLLGLFFYNSL